MPKNIRLTRGSKRLIIIDPENVHTAASLTAPSWLIERADTHPVIVLEELANPLRIITQSISTVKITAILTPPFYARVENEKVNIAGSQIKLSLF